LQLAKATGRGGQAFKQAIAADAKSVPSRLALANFFLMDSRPEGADVV
jgi:hypothetical protein